MAGTVGASCESPSPMLPLQPGSWTFSHGGSGLQEQALPQDKTHYASTCQVCAYIILANVSLAKANHVAKSRISVDRTVQGHEYWDMRLTGGH